MPKASAPSAAGSTPQNSSLSRSSAVTRKLSTRAEIASDLRSLGVRSGGVLLIHVSFRAVRPVEGGPAGLIEGFRATLGAEGTLVMPSWTGRDDEPFDPASTPASPDLGIVADTFWRMPGVIRSGHPFAFAALGPAAERIVAGPLPLPPHIEHSPVGHVREAEGQILLLGVGHDANTSLHLAEILGDAPYRVLRQITILRKGAPVRIDYAENDHCCTRFALADDWLRASAKQAEGRVGHAHARLMAARDLVAEAVRRLSADPLVFLHPESAGCAECDEARRSIGADEAQPKVAITGT